MTLENDSCRLLESGLPQRGARYAIEGVAVWPRLEPVEIQIRLPPFDPGHNDRRSLDRLGVVADLHDIHGNSVLELLGSDGSLGRTERPRVLAGKVIRTDRFRSVGLHDQTVGVTTVAVVHGELVTGDFRTHTGHLAQTESGRCN